MRIIISLIDGAVVNASKYNEGFRFAQVYSESEVDLWDIAYLSSLSLNIIRYPVTSYGYERYYPFEFC